jgi:isocitrate dehydrogenase
MGLFANVRPCVSYHPFVATKHPVMDVVIVRENEEDLYAGIEYRQTDDVVECLKVISRPGCEKIVRYAFEYARQYGRKKVTCFTKDNIMKLTDGLFHKVFDEIVPHYPDIASEHWIVDIGAAKMADTPENFDVIVMPNLYGDILSDVAAQIAGSVGLAGSSNIGEQGAMFEAIHGSAPRRAGQNLANPSGLLLGGVMMLVHIGQPDVAECVHNAWLKTIEDGVHTYDIYDEGVSTQKVGTKEFAQAVVARLGQTPAKLKAVKYGAAKTIKIPTAAELRRAPLKKDLVGIDIYVHDRRSPAEVADDIQRASTDRLNLTAISARGVMVWPGGIAETATSDNYRCRFLVKGQGQTVTARDLLQVITQAVDAGLDVIKTENLCNFEGQPAFSTIQGQ